MNTKENAIAFELLSQIGNQCRVSPDVAKTLAEAYKLVCEAAAIRNEREQEQ